MHKPHSIADAPLQAPAPLLPAAGATPAPWYGEARGLNRDGLPRHVAIIMDGNGRWAQARGKARAHGHEQGARMVKPIVQECVNLGVQALTLYSFSIENWKRPQREIDILMGLYALYLRGEQPLMMDNNVRFLHLGRREGLPTELIDALDETTALTAANTGLRLCLALNYGSRNEIIDAVRLIAADAAAGRLDPARIDEKLLASRLYTAGLPDVDLLIRTAGEMRLSNFLLWQISYAELVVTEKFWPDFSVDDLYAALGQFGRRERRFGAVAPPSPA